MGLQLKYHATGLRNNEIYPDQQLEHPSRIHAGGLLYRRYGSMSYTKPITLYTPLPGLSIPRPEYFSPLTLRNSHLCTMQQKRPRSFTTEPVRVGPERVLNSTMEQCGALSILHE